jgi:eukaryotic-like serine/threonine-protein kinase
VFSLIGRILGGKYEITGPLGEGGMARVFRARRLADGRLVAVKVLREQYAHDKEFVARFEREAQAVARLSHPRMVQVIDSGRDGDVHFIVMEFVPGEDLKTLLRRLGSLTEARAREIGAQVCEALTYAHERGIIHRDVKPQNILLPPGGQLKVTDFGIASAPASSEITATGTVLGSVQYLSPEQARGLPVGRSADLYSLGVVLYEAVTGVLPFDGDSPITIALKHVRESPPAPRGRGQSISREMERIILKALAKNPLNRYRSAEELREDLTGAAAHWRNAPSADAAEAAAGTRRVRPGDGTRRGGFRLLAPALGGILALVAVLLGLSFGWQSLKAYLNVPEVAVPDFIGRSFPGAQSLALQDHLSVQVVQQSYSRTVPAGFILSQDQPAGKVVKINRTIGLTTSLGPEMVTVPDVRRRPVTDARFIIEQSRLVLGEVHAAYNDSVSPGLIINQDPAPGASLERGTAVYLSVSKGPESVILPDLVGRSLDDARRALSQLGVTLREVTQVTRPDIPPGQVVATTPAARAPIKRGDGVTLAVAAAAAPGVGAAQPAGSGTPPPTSSDTSKRQARVNVIVPQGPPQQIVKIVVVDQQGAHVLYQKAHAPGDAVDTVVAASGYTIVQVYVDNRLIQEIRP